MSLHGWEAPAVAAHSPRRVYALAVGVPYAGDLRAPYDAP